MDQSMTPPQRPPSDRIDLFEKRPINLDGFTLGVRTVVAGKAPTFDQWSSAFAFAVATEDSSPFWVGDLWNYAMGRKEWEDRVYQFLAEAGWKLTPKSLINKAAISRAIAPSARPHAQSLSHADVVSTLPPEEQVEWLTKSRENDWTVRDLKLHRKAAERAKVIDVTAHLSGLYRVVLADPPWQYGNRPPSGVGSEEHYPTMTTDDICNLGLQAHTADDSVLFLWVTAPLLPDGLRVIDAWHYTYKTGMVWDKVDGTFSHYTGGNHEHMLIATRGSCLPDVPTELPDSVQVVRKSKIHSEKPEEFRRLIEEHWTRGPYLELFGRRQVDGWTVWGNDATLWPPHE